MSKTLRFIALLVLIVVAYGSCMAASIGGPATAMSGPSHVLVIIGLGVLGLLGEGIAELILKDDKTSDPRSNARDDCCSSCCSRSPQSRAACI